MRRGDRRPPLARTLAYCLLVLGANFAAHLLSGDLGHTPPVAIIGLWIGYVFWSSTVAAVTDQLATHLLRLNAYRDELAAGARRVVAWPLQRPGEAAEPLEQAGVRASDTRVEDDRSAGEPVGLSAGASLLIPGTGAARGNRIDRLTARQLQVVALLADGLRYRDVAACLSISEGQVQRHVARAVSRLGVRSANELVMVAVAERLVPVAVAPDGARSLAAEASDDGSG